MRKIVILSMVTLDGVMQAPGGPEEDTSGGFKFGGWVAPFDDEVSAQLMQKLMKPSDLLLGRKTFEIWENYWPKHEDKWPGVNDVTKYVLSTKRNKSNWVNTVFLNSVEDVIKLKETDGDSIQVWGSSVLIHELLKHDLADEIWLMIHPVILGKGKKLFDDMSLPASFKLAENTITPSGVIMANYRRAGEVETGRLDE